MVLTDRASALREIASGTAKREIGHDRLAPLRQRQDMFDVEGDAAGGLDQVAVLAHTSSACGDQRSKHLSTIFLVLREIDTELYAKASEDRAQFTI